MTAEEIIKELPKGLLGWYHFKENSRVLYLTDAEDNLKNMFVERGLEATCIRSSEMISDKDGFDYVVAIGVLESCKHPVAMLKQWKAYLKEDGVLLLGVDNRLGLRYFCGDRDKFTQRNFDGIEHYRRILPKDREQLEGQAYAKYEIEEMLAEAGIGNHKFYSVLPNLDIPQMIYSENYLPEEELSIRYFPMYNYPDSVFLEEEYLYSDMIKNGMFHTMANSYLLECPMNGRCELVKHVTVSLDRGRENALFTIIREDDKVEKRAAYEEGKKKLQVLMDNTKDLREHGLSVIEGVVKKDTYEMPYVKGISAVTYFTELLKADKEKFVHEVDRFRELILQSSEHISEENGVVILKKGYLDLVPLNCFYIKGDFVFYDQEFYQENYPANAIITRMIDIIYNSGLELESILPREYLIQRYHLEEHLDEWRRLGWEFTAKLRNQRELRVFNERYQRNYEVVNTNRQRMNYSATEYQHLFVDIFRNTENRKLIIFGSGTFAKKFLALYQEEHPVYAIVDNNTEKWGQMLEGIKIVSPAIFEDLDPNEYKVIVCIKNYVAVMKQLQEAGVRNIGIYDSNMEYPRNTVHRSSVKDETSVAPKKYHIGYIAGVFDLFHVGHLNMFRRAKEQCDYLIVGVVTDEGVRRNKKTEPFIPFEERIEMVRACRYVDEAVEIPFNYGGTRDAYRLYHFDCQFSGSDYIDDPNWLVEKEFLEKQGAEMVFFPYTESTSSTKIKAMINKRLLS
ncbi:MAG: adenylyltransferase/cytidyltransferase family protein [Lachnospiraceae bacterium]|nr:adenylyltransferase/cytidyltransferase family protein [Lachnospiraceae bacterium]